MFLQILKALFDVPGTSIKKGDVLNIVTETTLNAIKSTEGQQKIKEATNYAGKNLNQLTSYFKQEGIKNIN